jgi:two-component system, NarL family, response regulator NreC
MTEPTSELFGTFMLPLRRRFAQCILIEQNSRENTDGGRVGGRLDETVTSAYGTASAANLAAVSAEAASHRSPEPAMTSIVLADDHTVIRNALRMLLDAEPGFEVVAEAGDADSALRYVRGHKPTVLLLDLNMPGRSSLEAVPDILEASPSTEIVVLTMQNEPAFARRALQAGVRGYVLKEAADAELVQAVRSAAAGDTYLQPALGARLAAGAEARQADELSERERDVLRLIALGHTNAEVAEQLFISIRTVESHRAHIQQKLRLSSRAELVRYALERGLVET